MGSALWWVAAAALAGRREEEARLAELEAARCDGGAVEGFQIHTGFAQGDQEVEAIDAAIHAARKVALEVACAGKGAARCAGISRHVEQWKQPYWNPATRRACAHVGISRRWLDDDRGDAARLDRELTRLAADVAARVGTTPIALAPVVRGTARCGAGEVGGALNAELRNALGAIGGVRLTGGSGPASDRQGGGPAAAAPLGYVLETSLHATGDRVILSATLHPPDGSPGSPLAGFDFPGDLFGAVDAGGCGGEDPLGLRDGRRVGDDLRVTRIALEGTGLYCEGDLTTATVQVNRPSRVQVYSVYPDGRALLVWPHGDLDGHVERAVSLGELVLHPLEGGGDQRLVAVAVGPEEGFGPLEGSGVCLVDGGLRVDLVPRGAAVGSVTYGVLPFDADTCLRRGVRELGPAPLPGFSPCSVGRWDPGAGPPPPPAAE